MNPLARMEKLARRCLVASTVLVTLALHAQDVVLSSPASVPLMLSPAMAGALNDLEAQAVHRDQVNGLSAPFRTVMVSVDGVLRFGQGRPAETSGKFGIGLYAVSDKTSALRSTGAGVDVAYHVPLSRFSTLGAGLSVGLLQVRQGTADGQWASQYNGFEYDPDLPSGESFGKIHHTAMDLGGGLQYMRRWGGTREKRPSEFCAGIAGQHLGRPRLLSNGAQDRMAMRWSVFGKGRMMLAGERNWLSSEAFFIQQGPGTLVIAGGAFGHVFGAPTIFQNAAIQVDVELGAAYRNDNAVLAMLKVAWKSYSISMVYDIPAGGMEASRSATEIALSYMLAPKRRS